jgi:hypothetical protein
MIPRNGSSSVRYGLTIAPNPHRGARSNNLAVVPGSLLLRRRDWQEMANRLPVNAVLILLPDAHSSQKRALLATASLLARRGHQVSVIPATELK